MAKTNTPFLSLGSRGSIGNTITSQKRGNNTLLRLKPTPSNPKTLAQTYQRWLYLDYAHLWTEQSAATRAEYRTAGTRYHLTGYQYWMKYHLTHLPYLVGMWILDNIGSGQAVDISRNALTGTVVGAIPAPGFFAQCANFDGLNDWIQVPSNPLLDLDRSCTLEAWVWTPQVTGAWERIAGRGYAYTNIGFSNLNLPYARIHGLGGGLGMHGWIAPIPNQTWTHLALTYDADAGANNFRMLTNGILNNAVTETGTIIAALDFAIGASSTPSEWGKLHIDHVVLWSRALTDAHLRMHALRRYPAQ